MTASVPVNLWDDRRNTDFWPDGNPAVLKIEVTDVDEIRLWVDKFVSIYVSRENADKLSKYVASAAVTDVVLPTKANG